MSNINNKYKKVGRPRLSEDEKADVNVISVRMTNEQKEKIEKICTENNIHFSTFFNSCINMGLSIYDKMYNKKN